MYTLLDSYLSCTSLFKNRFFHIVVQKHYISMQKFTSAYLR